MLDKIQLVIQRTFINKDLQVNLDMRFEDIDDYDSIKHLEMFMEIEKEFNIAFDIDRIGEIDNFSGLVKELKKLCREQ